MLKKIKCKNCGELFSPRNTQQKYCTSNCKYQYSRKYDYIKTKCTNCGKEIIKHRDEVKKNANIYCSKECKSEYQHSMYYEMRNCEICNCEYECLKSSTKKFCSKDCQNKWQTTQVGKLNSHYIDNIVKCNYCGKEFHTHQYKLNTNENNFCGVDCRQKWYSEIWSQSDEWKNKSRIRATNMLKDNCFSHTDTTPQIIINNLLDELHISYENEYNCKYFSIDNALTIDSNLYLIEIMGTYWHCDRRKYNDIPYKTQYSRIIKDKAKNTYVKNNYNINILYLWEEDIKNNLELCKKLILKYINNNGILSFYNSSDYNLQNNNLFENANKIKQYMCLDNINEYVNIQLKQKISRKQQNKWITFNCEICGKEKEQLISHYNKSTHHCCSYECANISQCEQVTVICYLCKKEFKMILSEYNRRKNKNRLFCSLKCKQTYSQVKFNCEYCNKETIVTKSKYKESKHHYCCHECAVAHRNEKDDHHSSINNIIQNTLND